MYFFILTLGLIFGAYQAAQNKIHHSLDLSAIHLGMTPDELEKAFGTPSAKFHNQLTFILNDGSELFVTFRDNLVSSAKIKFYKPIRVEDPQIKRLSLVQMDLPNNGNNPSWFFAGNPAEGLIYKITADGFIEGLTWVPPFTYGNNQAKHLQALLRDFQHQQTLKL